MLRNIRDRGKVEISPKAISTIAWKAVMECYGVVGIASRRLMDGLMQIVKHDNYHRGIVVHFADHQIVIELYIVVEHGTRISEVARNVASTVKFSVEKALGLPVAAVNVNVQRLRVSNSH